MSYLSINNNCPIIFNHYTSTNRVLSFKDTDSEELFNENRNKLNDDWYYHNKPIEYRYNSWGYRTKEFDDLKDDYIVTFGCSFTEGVGLHYDDLWSTKIGKKLNVDVFNLGVGATGPDFQMYNSILLHNFLLTNRKLPKMVIYQWPFKHRTSYMFNNENGKLDLELFSPTYDKEIYPPNAKHYGQWYMESFLSNGGEKIKNVNFSILTSNNLWKSLGIPVFNWTWEDDFDIEGSEYFQHKIKLHSIIDNTNYLARDLSHNGHESQNLVVDEILKSIGNGIS